MSILTFNKSLFALLMCLAFVLPETAAQDNIWKTLSKITYRKEFDEFMGFEVEKPVFSDAVRKLDGKEVVVKGFIIPVEGYKGHKEFVFSAFPYSMCFFCGGAGPETVMEVYADEEVEYTTEAIYLKGVLHLNADDVNHLMYKLEEARQVEEPGS